MNATPMMPCPNCGAEVALDTKALLAGKHIKCTSCDIAIGLQESSRNVVGDALAKMESVRKLIVENRRTKRGGAEGA